MKVYAFSYDPVATANITGLLQSFIADNKHVSSWSKPFEGMFLIKSGSSKEDLYNSINGFFSGAVQFFITEAEQGHSIGVLLQQVWDWLNQGAFLNYLNQNNQQ